MSQNGRPLNDEQFEAFFERAVELDDDDVHRLIDEVRRLKAKCGEPRYWHERANLEKYGEPGDRLAEGCPCRRCVPQGH